MKIFGVQAAALAAIALVGTGSTALASPAVLSDTELDVISAGSALSVAQTFANALGRRTLAVTGTDTLAVEGATRRYTRGLGTAFAAGDFAATEVFTQSGVAGGGTAATVAGQAATTALGGTSQSWGRTVARGGPIASVAHGTNVSIAVGAQTDAAAAAGSGATGNFLAISNQIAIPVNAGRVSVAVTVPWAVAVSLPDSVNVLLGR